MRLSPNTSAEHAPLGLGWIMVPVASMVLAVGILFGSPLIVAAMVGGLILAALIGVSPQLGLLLMLAAVPLEEMGVLYQSGGMRLSLAKIFGVITFVSWLAHTVIKRKKIWIPRPGWILLGYFAVGFISLWYASEPVMGRTMLMRLATTVIFYLMVANLLDSWPTIRRALIVFMVSSVLVSGFAVLQQHVSWFTYEQRGAKEIESNVQFGAQRDEIEDQLLGKSILRSGGTSYHPLLLSLNTVILLPLLVFALVFFKDSVPLRMLLFSAVLVDFTAMADTASRSGLLATIVALVLLVAKRIIPLNRITFGVALISVVAAWTLLPEGFKERVLNLSAYSVEESVSLRYREELLVAGWAVFKQHPLNGVGLGNLVEINSYMPTYDLGGYGSGVHNAYLQVALETGVLGLGLILWFFYRVFADLRHTCAAENLAGDDFRKGLLRAIAVSIWVLLFYGLSLDIMNFSLKNAWFLLALAAALTRVLATPTATESGRGIRVNKVIHS